MKKTILNFSISLFIVLIPSLLLILINSLLIYNCVIPYKEGSVITSFVSIIAFFIFSFLFGKKQKSHGMLQGLILLILYLLISFLLLKDYSNILIKTSKALCLFFGPIIGVNFSKN